MTQTEQQKKRRIAFLSIAFLGVILTALLFVWIGLQTNGARRLIVDNALSSINSDDLQIGYGELEGNWPWRITVQNVEIADRDGIWLTIEEVALNWSPLSLLRNTARASTLIMDGAHIMRTPISDTDPDPNVHILPELPTLPVDLQLRELLVTNLQLDEDVIGVAFTADIRGSLLWTEQSIESQIAFLQKGDEGLEAAISLGLNLSKATFDLSLQGQEGPNGILRRLANLDTAEPFKLTFNGSGPGRNWQGRFVANGGTVGRADATVTITSTSPLAVSVAGSIAPGKTLPGEWRTALGSNVNMRISASVLTREQATIENAEILTDSGVSITGMGKLNGPSDNIDMNLAIAIEDASVFSDLADTPLKGSITLNTRSTGAVISPKTEIEIDGTGIAVDDTAFGEVSGLVSWPSQSNQDGRLTLSIDSPLGSGTVQSEISRQADGSTTFSNLNVDWLSTKIEANLTAHTDRNVSGDLSFDIASLQQISFLTQFGGVDVISGAAKGRLSLAAPSQLGRSEIDATLINFRLGSGADTFSAERLSAQGRMDQNADGTIGLSVTANQVVLPGLFSSTSIDALSFTVNGTQETATWSFEAKRINQSQDNLDARGNYNHVGPEVRTITVRGLTGLLGDKPMALENEITLKQSEAGWRLSPFSLRYGSGTAKGSLAVEKLGLTATLSLVEFPVAFNGSDFETISGALTGTLDIDTLAKEKSGQCEFALSSKTDSLDFAETRISADWDGESLAFRGTLEGAGTFEGSLPLRHNDGAFDIPETEAVRFSSKLQGEVGPLWRLGPYSEYDIRGLGQIDVSATGTWSDPQISGTASLREGYFESFGDGIFLRDLEVDLSAENSERATMTLVATDGKKGRINGRGEIRFAAEENVPLTITADFDKAEILRSETLDAQISGQATLAGNTEDLTLTGNIIVNRMDIRIPNELPPSVVDLPVELVNVPPALQNVIENGPEQAENPIALDLGVRAQNRVFVDGRGLSSEWKAYVNVSGDTNVPRVEGKAEIIKGTFQFAGRPFNLEKGEITFDGGKEIDPRLDVLASREDDDITVGVRVRGLASDPQISLQSSPSLPQEDVLARILFGKPVADLTYVELAQLGESIASLSGKGFGGGGRGLFGSVRQSLGVDVLSVDTGSIAGTATDDEEAAGPSLTVGKYVTNRVYVGVTQGTDEDSTAVEVEVDITRRLSLSTEVGQRANSNIGLNWSWDY